MRFVDPGQPLSAGEWRHAIVAMDGVTCRHGTDSTQALAVEFPTVDISKGDVIGNVRAGSALRCARCAPRDDADA